MIDIMMNVSLKIMSHFKVYNIYRSGQSYVRLGERLSEEEVGGNYLEKLYLNFTNPSS